MTSQLEAFDLRTIPAQRWKNGAGITREIACSPRGAGTASFDWRFSVAEVERAAPFSAFPGIDRCIVLLAGAGLLLRSADGHFDHRLDTALRPYRFSGDQVLTARPIDGPCIDFNVMTRRGAWHSEVDTLTSEATQTLEGPAMLLCCEGEWHSDAPGMPIGQVGQGLLLRDGQATLHLRPSAGRAARLLRVRVCHDPAP